MQTLFRSIVLAALFFGSASTLFAGELKLTLANGRVTILGTDGEEEITGTDGRDVIDAGDGTDIVNAEGGDDGARYINREAGVVLVAPGACEEPSAEPEHEEERDGRARRGPGSGCRLRGAAG